MGQQNQIARRSFKNLPPEVNDWLNTIVDAVNSGAGYNGPAVINDHLSIQGNRLMNVAPPVEATDAISSGHAQANYSASALAPQLEIGGANALSSYRALNSRSQTETYSSFLNGVVSGPGNANTITPTATTGGGTTTITIPASTFQFADGTTRHYPARTDTVTNPASFTVASWLVTTPGLASVTTTATNSVTLNGVVTLAGTGGIDGAWVVTQIFSPTVFQVAVSATSGSGTGGTVATSGTYYYSVIKNNPIIQIQGVVTASDTPYDRLPASNDSRQLVAVVVVNSGGGVTTASAGGGTPVNTANAGAFF